MYACKQEQGRETSPETSQQNKVVSVPLKKKKHLVWSGIGFNWNICKWGHLIRRSDISWISRNVSLSLNFFSFGEMCSGSSFPTNWKVRSEDRMYSIWCYSSLLFCNGRTVWTKGQTDIQSFLSSLTPAPSVAANCRCVTQTSVKATGTTTSPACGANQTGAGGPTVQKWMWWHCSSSQMCDGFTCFASVTLCVLIIPPYSCICLMAFLFQKRQTSVPQGHSAKHRIFIDFILFIYFCIEMNLHSL